MARKKSVRKRSAKRILRGTKLAKKKFDFALKRLLFFGIIFIISFAIYFVSVNEYVEGVFAFLSIVFGFLALAFLIVFLIFLFGRILKK